MDGQDRLGDEQRLALELAAIGQRLTTISTEMRERSASTATAVLEAPEVARPGEVPQPPATPVPTPPAGVPQQPTGTGQQPTGAAQQPTGVPSPPAGVPQQQNPWSQQAAASTQQPPPPGQQFPGQQPPPPGHQFPQPPQARWPHPQQQQQQWPAPQPRETLFEKLGKDGAGAKLLAWVGGAITVLGFVMLLVLAVQRGWLGPMPRVIGGAVFSGALVGIGMWLHRNPAGRTGAMALAFTGFAGLYLDVLAATSLYGYLPESVGLVVGLAVAATGVVLALKWESQALAVTVVAACAVCSPIITEGFTVLLVGFLLVLKMASTPVQIKRNWPGLAVAGGFPPILASLLTTANAIPRSYEWTVVGVAAATTVVGIAVAFLTIRKRPDDIVAVALIAGSALPALFATTLLENPANSILAGVVAAVLLAIWMVPDLPRGFTTAAGATGMLALFQTTVIALDGNVRTAIVLAEAVLLAVLAARLNKKTALAGSVAFGVLGFFMTIGQAVPITWLVEEPRFFNNVEPGDYAAGLVTAIVLGVFATILPWAALKMQVLREPAKHPFPWIVSGLVLLYGAAGAVLCAALLMSPNETGFLFGHSMVTVSWTIAALFLLVKGINNKALRISGLILVGAAVVKLVLFDLSALDGVARVLAFLGAGLVLLTAGTRYAKLVTSAKNPESYESKPVAPHSY
ncbi:DUF2339 domain-containing protein [Lentzea flaviverrucosa]|uniref:Predicted membrane protein n=1 Tax=Lentzea flaviverrucosa TaxID=200379 RepID=A0A1H9XU52_9PSEU|nr:DUF2339 domain-containing protein [Lentzea flaviverrucosa]RDI18871.1 putative membrane protein DUF2339 [Lentzea flaviverrucosa]SES49690.1 Predicted membrane protein [Lentzea flaviverrucosa]